ncbi:putative transcription factor bHLH84-like [Capsicum annuum]|nr:putative transcription factor bHLH84-like [Capsicum annuum]
MAKKGGESCRDDSYGCHGAASISVLGKMRRERSREEGRLYGFLNFLKKLVGKDRRLIGKGDRSLVVYPTSCNPTGYMGSAINSAAKPPTQVCRKIGVSESTTPHGRRQRTIINYPYRQIRFQAKSFLNSCLIRGQDQQNWNNGMFLDGYLMEALNTDADADADADCLKNPLKPQYNGGIVVNSELNDGLNGWSLAGDAKIKNNVSSDGNKFIVASERKGPNHGFSQTFQLDKDKFYVISGWVQVNHGDDTSIAVIFKTQDGFQHAAWAIAKSGCWSMFKGGLANASGPAQLYFETNNTAIDIWADSISVQPFSQEEWERHQNQSIEKVRKSKVAIQVVDSQGKPLPNATIALEQGRADFPFGVAINANILDNTAYQNWFFSRFKVTVFEDEMKWYSTEFDNTTMFLNEFFTIEKTYETSSPANYLKKIKQLRTEGYGGPLGIGLQGHFSLPIPPYIRSALDMLASAKLPIWITELDVTNSTNQVKFLDQIIKEVVSHPAVEGVLIWSGWKRYGCYRMCLTDNNFKNLPTGNVVDKARVTLSHEGLVGITNAEGYFETSLFHGDYKAIVAHPSVPKSFQYNFTVTPNGGSDHVKSLSYKFTTTSMSHSMAGKKIIGVVNIAARMSNNIIKESNIISVDSVKPQHEGGIVVNPELNDGLNGWTILGDAKIENVVSSDGNNFIVASHRKGPYHGWLQVSHGDDANVAVIFKTQSGFQHAAWGIAKSGCWSMFKGGLVVNASGPAQLYFEIRKNKVAIQVVDAQGKRLPNATISLVQRRANFPFGVAINKNILNDSAYQNWFFSRFKYTVFEDEMKWYSTEVTQGKVDYSTSDAMVKLCKSKGVTIRGHNILWDDPKMQPYWVRTLSPQQLFVAAGKRVGSVVAKYRGQVIHWDVVNENLHSNFFESKLGPTASATFFRLASQFDNKTPLFLNEYNTIEDQRDGASSPVNYLNKIKQIRSGGYAGPLGIGLEGHFVTPYIRTALDTLASAKLPIWITELDVQRGPNQVRINSQIKANSRFLS